MKTRKILLSSLIAAGVLGSAALPLTASAADFGFSFNATPVNHDRFYDQRFNDQRFHDNDRHRYQPTRWDRDGDGIPNRYDPTPDGRVRAMRDSDGDGVPDRFDNYPHNPRWR